MKKLATLACLLAATATGWSQTEFKTSDAAVKAFRQALGAQGDRELFKVFGPDLGKLLEPSAAERQESRRLLGRLFDERWRLSQLYEGRKVLRLGAEGWPFPVTVVQEAKGWHFDTAGGVEETLNRRIGQNELVNLETLTCLMLAEEAYRKEGHDKSEVHRYTSLFRSTPGKHDGLYWDVKPNQELSPLQAALKDSGEYAQGRAKGAPWWGYHYRFLPGQGPAAPGGAYDYTIAGQQVAGWSVVAYPVNYGKSGIMTFLCSHDGKVYQRDLGPETTSQASQIRLFDPTEGWEAVEPEDLAH